MAAFDQGKGLRGEAERNQMERCTGSTSPGQALVPSAGNGETTEPLDRRLLSRAILPRSGGRLGGKERGQQELTSVGHCPLAVGGLGVGGLGWGERLPLVPCPPPCLFPLLLPLLSLSLLQVRSSLGTNILSALAAFAGTAVLLMDFGVTNWVCFQMPPAVGQRGEWQSHIGGWVKQEFATSGGQSPGHRKGLPVPTDP